MGWADNNNPKTSGIDSASDTPQNPKQYTTTSSAGSHSHTVTINTTGGNQSHENRQPYIVIYRFRRKN